MSKADALDPTQVHFIYGFNEWSAYYYMGQLKYVGDTSNVFEDLLDALGIETDQNEDFMLGSNYRGDVAETLEEVFAYRDDRIKRGNKAAELRDQAQALIDAAEKLERD